MKFVKHPCCTGAIVTDLGFAKMYPSKAVRSALKLQSTLTIEQYYEMEAK